MFVKAQGKCQEGHPRTLYWMQREKPQGGVGVGGLEWGKVKDNFHLKKPKYLFIVKFDNLILCNCRRRGKKNPGLFRRGGPLGSMLTPPMGPSLTCPAEQGLSSHQAP